MCYEFVAKENVCMTFQVYPCLLLRGNSLFAPQLPSCSQFELNRSVWRWPILWRFNSGKTVCVSHSWSWPHQTGTAGYIAGQWSGQQGCGFYWNTAVHVQKTWPNTNINCSKWERVSFPSSTSSGVYVGAWLQQCLYRFQFMPWFL